VRYREHAPSAELGDIVVCTWERRVPAGSDAPAAMILPDGCVDLIWRGSELIVAGPDRGPLSSAVPAGDTVVGVRLRPGAAGAILGLPASELRDLRIPLEEVWRERGAELEQRLGLAASATQRRRLLEGAVRARHARAPEPDRMVIAATRALGLPGARVAALGAALGVSERQLRRRFAEAVGYGPKLLDRVLRFQRFLALAPRLARGEDDLARAAFALGYSDQAHLTREVGELAGRTPAKLIAERA
jgi:AraC-like DNA-binding protein